MEMKLINQTFWDITPCISYMRDDFFSIYRSNRANYKNIVFISWLKWNIQIKF